MEEVVPKKRKVEPYEHHRQLEICQTRPAYRQGRKHTAVKVSFRTESVSKVSLNNSVFYYNNETWYYIIRI